MEAASIKEYEQLEQNYWWFLGRRKIILSVLQKYAGGGQKQILDWGCGPGANFPLLEKFGTVLGVDSSEEAIAACHRKGISSVVLASHPSQLYNRQFDFVTAFDVLEHIPNDAGFLREIKSLIKPGGRLLVTVPAYQFLWSAFDVAVQHQRRYTKSKLDTLLKANGFEPIFSSYFNFFLTPAFIGYRGIKKLLGDKPSTLNSSAPRFPASVNTLLAKILGFEAQLVPPLSLPFGTSIIILAKAAN